MSPPPPSPNGKPASRRSPLLLPLVLLTALLLVVLIGAAVYFSLFSPTTQPPYDPEELESQGPIDHVPIVDRPHTTTSTTTESSTSTVTSTTSTSTTRKATTPTSTSTSAKTTTEVTTTPSTSTTTEDENIVVIEAVGEEEITTSTTNVREDTTTTVNEETTTERDEERNDQLQKNSAEVDTCKALTVEKTSCGHIQRQRAPSTPSALPILHNAFNLTSAYNGLLTVGGEIFVKPQQPVNQIALSAGNKIRGLNDVTVVDCATGEAICSVAEHDTAQQILSITLASPSSSMLRLIIAPYQAVFPERDEKIVYKQMPQTFTRGQKPVLGTNYASDDDAKQIFPIIPGSRSPFTLCLSGDAADKLTMGGVRAENGCFVQKLPLTPRHWAFLVHQKTDSLFFNATVGKPEFEVIFSFAANFDASKYEWVHNEVDRVLSTLSSWADFPFPLRRLTLIEAPIKQTRRASPLGFVIIKIGDLSNQKNIAMRLSLLSQLVSQWIGGVVSTDECLQESLSTYLEWRINDELVFVNRSTTAEKIRDSRPVSLDPAQKPSRSRIASLVQKSQCKSYLPEIFHSLDATYGEETVKRIVSIVLKRHSFEQVDIATWAEVVQEVTESETAAASFLDWFSPSHFPRPVLLAAIQQNGLKITQVNGNATQDEDKLHLWRLPIELASSRDTVLMDLQAEKEQNVTFQSDDYIIVDPKRKSTAVVAYDVDGYQRLVRCSADSRCPADKQQLKSIFKDLGAAFTANLLGKSPRDQQRLAQWGSVLAHARQHGELTGDAACCVAFALKEAPSKECTWAVSTMQGMRGVCPGIELADKIRRG